VARRPGVVVALLGALACGGSAGSEPVSGDLTFAVMGDAPYYWHEARRYEHLVAALNADSLDWVIHVGDLFWKPCSDERMLERLEAMQRIRHPVVYTPGDNEWTDCWGRREGGFEPLERLGRLRDLYFPSPGQSLGGSPMEVVSQASDSVWSEFVEHQRWTRGGIVFATLHLVGSRNGMEGFPGRADANDREARRRTEAATAWLRDTFEDARATAAGAIVLIEHADLGFEDPADEYRRAFEPFLRALEEEVATFDGPVLLVHGDGHHYTVDSPLVDRRTGRLLENFTRMQVMGSPEVGWVRVVVDTAGPRFSFVPHRIPAWKIW
jgi:hypothetical protein